MLAIRAMKLMAAPICLLLVFTTATLARDDGRYANSPLKPWFESLEGARASLRSSSIALSFGPI